MLCPPGTPSPAPSPTLGGHSEVSGHVGHSSSEPQRAAALTTAGGPETHAGSGGAPSADWGKIIVLAAEGVFLGEGRPSKEL